MSAQNSETVALNERKRQYRGNQVGNEAVVIVQVRIHSKRKRRESTYATMKYINPSRTIKLTRRERPVERK